LKQNKISEVKLSVTNKYENNSINSNPNAKHEFGKNHN